MKKTAWHDPLQECTARLVHVPKPQVADQSGGSRLPWKMEEWTVPNLRSSRPHPTDRLAALPCTFRADIFRSNATDAGILGNGADSVIGRMLGRHRVTERIGSGGMGEVYLAEDTKLSRVVALKVLPEGWLNDTHATSRFEREMEIVGRLDHANIVRAMDAREVDGTQFLVMEFVEGMDLAELIRLGGPLPVADACELIRQAAVGLQCAHEHGLVHRDIKPSNLILSATGQVKVLDLGLARFQLVELQGKELTGIGQVMGTPDYISPEQAEETRSVDVRTDIYSLGCTLYKLLCGRAPFETPEYESPLKKVTGHSRDPVVPVEQLRSDTPPPLAATLARMLAKAPADRYATPREVTEALTEFCGGCDPIRIIRDALKQRITNQRGEEQQG